MSKSLQGFRRQIVEADPSIRPVGRTRLVKFAFLLYGDEAAESALTANERRLIVEGHLAFSKMLRERDALRFGEALAPSTTAATVRPRRRGVSDGPFAETKEQLGGFWVIEVADLDVALAWAERCAEACRAPIEVRPFDGLA
jgi:hypothetical protein